jgi:hypothetical protein
MKPRELLQELVLQRLKSLLEADGVMQLQSELMCAAMRSSSDDPEKALRRARTYLRRAWLLYGEELGIVMKDVADAVALPPPE